MPLANTTRRYGSLTQGLHWLTALLILAQIPLGLVANRMAADLMNPDIASTTSDFSRTATLFSLHKTLGVVLLLLAVVRILWVLVQPRPGLLNADRPVEAFLAETVHWLLYGGLILVPMTGWVSHAATTGFAPILWPLDQSLPFVPKSETVAAAFGWAHVFCERILVVALALHVAGALKHHIVDRDATLRRILPGGPPPPAPPGRRRGHWPLAAAVAVWAVAIAFGLADRAPQPAPPARDMQSEPRASLDWQITEGALVLRLTGDDGDPIWAFPDWTAAISFAARTSPGPAGALDVIVDTTTAITAPDAALMDRSGFPGAATFPTMILTGEIERTDAGHDLRGFLTLRDQSLPLAGPMEISTTGDEIVLIGTWSVDGLDPATGSEAPGSESRGLVLDVSLTGHRLD